MAARLLSASLRHLPAFPSSCVSAGVLALDHHCPWTGKCIGAGNLLYFYAFLTTLSAHLGLVAVSTVAYFATGKAAARTGP